MWHTKNLYCLVGCLSEICRALFYFPSASTVWATQHLPMLIRLWCQQMAALVKKRLGNPGSRLPSAPFHQWSLLAGPNCYMTDFHTFWSPGFLFSDHDMCTTQPQTAHCKRAVCYCCLRLHPAPQPHAQDGLICWKQQRRAGKAAQGYALQGEAPPGWACSQSSPLLSVCQTDWRQRRQGAQTSPRRSFQRTETFVLERNCVPSVQHITKTASMVVGTVYKLALKKKTGSKVIYMCSL